MGKNEEKSRKKRAIPSLLSPLPPAAPGGGGGDEARGSGGGEVRVTSAHRAAARAVRFDGAGGYAAGPATEIGGCAFSDVSGLGGSAPMWEGAFYGCESLPPLIASLP